MRPATGLTVTISDAESDIGGFSMLGANLDAQVPRLAVQASQGQAPKGSPAQQVGDYYRAALDMRQRDAAGLQPLQADLGLTSRATAADLARLSVRVQASAGHLAADQPGPPPTTRTAAARC